MRNWELLWFNLERKKEREQETETETERDTERHREERERDGHNLDKICRERNELIFKYCKSFILRIFVILKKG